MLTLLTVALSVPSAGDARGIKAFVDQKIIEVEGVVSKGLGPYEQLEGAIEYLTCAEGGKIYESMLVLRCEPTEFYEALL